jgi:hypothetical protein
MELTGGTFQEEVHDVLANDEHGMVLAIRRLERNGVLGTASKAINLR